MSADRKKLIAETAKALTGLTDSEWEIATVEGTDHLAGYFDAAARAFAVFERAHADLGARIGRAVVAVQDGEPQEVVLGMLRGDARYEHNTVVFEKAHTPTDDEHLAQMTAFETAKLEARNFIRHDPHVWHEALEDALDKVLPAVWSAAADFRRTVQGEPCDCMDRYCRKDHDCQSQGE